MSSQLFLLTPSLIVQPSLVENGFGVVLLVVVLLVVRLVVFLVVFLVVVVVVVVVVRSPTNDCIH